MGALEYIIIGGLAIACVGLGIWYYLQTKKNYQASISQTLIPFTSTVDPTTGVATPFTDASGNPQLSCPAGTSINIVGAFFDIADPYGECTSNPGGVVGYICNPSYVSPQGCSTADDCPGGSGVMNCNSQGFCQLAPQSSSGACPSGYSSVLFNNVPYCIPTDVCGPGVPNPVCSPTGSGQCAVRDATDSVGAKCNGRSECGDLAITDFGPYPCPALAPPTTPNQCIEGYDSDGNPIWNQSPARAGYCGLPYSPGWPGGAPSGSTPQGAIPGPSSSLGYTMHGIYACV